jgi:hypothetical protein
MRPDWFDYAKQAGYVLVLLALALALGYCSR